MLLKTCYVCSKELPLRYFNGNAQTKDRKTNQCAACIQLARLDRGIDVITSDPFKYKTEEELLGRHYDEFVRKVEDFRKNEYDEALRY